jgi:hypothetical protein
MPITAIVTPASARALTTPARVVDELGDVGRTDAQLTILISRATAVLERWCGRVFARETVDETWFTTSLREVFLERAPVASITSVTLGPATNPTTVDAAQYEVTDPSAGRVRFELFDIGLPPDVRLSEMAYGYAGAVSDPGGGRIYGYRRPLEQRVVARYTGGWVTPAWPSGTIDLPDDLEGAAILLVRTMLGRQDREADVASIRLGDASWTYARPVAGTASSPVLTDEIQAMVAPYRRAVL